MRGRTRHAFRLTSYPPTMTPDSKPGRLTLLKQWLLDELRHLSAIHPSTRSWQMPLAAALASGLPLLVGAYFGHMDYGLASSLGGLVFLYLPNTPLHHRMVFLMACAFAMISCYALGLMSHFAPVLLVPVLIFITTLVTMLARFYGLGAPGSLFFVMAAAIGTYMPIEVPQVPLMVGLIAMGCLLAFMIAFVYSLHAVRVRAPLPVPDKPETSFDFVIFESVVIGVFVGLSLGVAQLLQMYKPYWVPVSCLAVIQGSTLRAVWSKQLHRVVGTAGGLALAGGLLMAPLNPWGLACTMMTLSLIIEVLVVRNYAAAVIFITPLTILLAEAAAIGHGAVTELIRARFFDTVLGCAVGLAGAWCMHSPRFRTVLGAWMRRLIPARLAR